MNHSQYRIAKAFGRTQRPLYGIDIFGKIKDMPSGTFGPNIANMVKAGLLESKSVHDFDLVGSNIDPAATLGLSRLSVVSRLGFRSNFAYVVDGLDGQDTSPAGTRFRSGNYRNEATIRPG